MGWLGQGPLQLVVGSPRDRGDAFCIPFSLQIANEISICSSNRARGCDEKKNSSCGVLAEKKNEIPSSKGEQPSLGFSSSSSSSSSLSSSPSSSSIGKSETDSRPDFEAGRGRKGMVMMERAPPEKENPHSRGSISWNHNEGSADEAASLRPRSLKLQLASRSLPCPLFSCLFFVGARARGGALRGRYLGATRFDPLVVESSPPPR